MTIEELNILKEWLDEQNEIFNLKEKLTKFIEVV